MAYFSGLKFAKSAAITISSFEAPIRLYLILFYIVSLKRTGSWLTTPKYDLKKCKS